MGFDPISYLLGKKAGGGGGVTVEPLSVTENGITTAPSGKAYSPVTVNVSNSYVAGDEGKVVSNGALVAQTAHAQVTQNGTINTTLNNSVSVNVPNPNSVETINGTLNNPFGSYMIGELAYMANVENSINMFLVVDGSVLGMGVYPLSMLKPLSSDDNGLLFFGASYLPNDTSHYMVADVEYQSGLKRARMMVGGTTVTDVMSYASYITTTLTIIHHPLPEGNT